MKFKNLLQITGALYKWNAERERTTENIHKRTLLIMNVVQFENDKINKKMI